MSARSSCVSLAVAFGLALLSPSGVSACTGLMLKAKDGSVVSGRTAEFGIPLDLGIAFTPKGTAFTGTTPLGAGMAYTAKYAAVGVTAFGAPTMLDGMNDQGLAAAAFYFPTFASYAPVTAATQKTAVAPTEFTNYLLAQFASVEEVRAALTGGAVTIAPTVDPKWGSAPAPFHFIVYDKSGAALVIEPIDGKLVLYDNPIGVITNSPPFDWHTTNLRNYISLRPLNVPPVKLDSMVLQPLGQGSGMVGLPGDFTPPSRFVRSAAFSSAAVPSANAADAVLQALHILNNFDIPVGIVKDKDGTEVGYDYTLMTVSRDPQALRYYWKTYEDQTIRMVDLKALAAQSGPAKMRQLMLAKTQPIADMTKDLPN